MKKWSIGIIATLLVASFALTGFTRDRGYYHRYGPDDYTTEQKATYLNFLKERNQLEKDFLYAEVEAGRMTKAVADAHIVLMNDRLDRIEKDGFQHYRMTKEENLARNDLREKIRTIRYEHIKNAVASGVLTQEEADRMLDYRGHNSRR